MPTIARPEIDWTEPNRVTITRDGQPARGTVQTFLTDDDEELLREEREAAARRRAEFARSPVIEQAGGAKFSREATMLVESGTCGSPEAAELVQALWKHAPVHPVGERLNGLQAAALMATGSEVAIGKLEQRIEFIGNSGTKLTLNLKLVAHALRREVANNHCRCGAKKAGRPDDCADLDEVFFQLSDALLRGKIADIRGGSREPIDQRNAWSRSFLRSQVLQLIASRAGGDAN